MDQTAITAIHADIPVLLWGPPGVGKTQWIQAVGRALDLKVHTIILSQSDPSDFAIPVRDGDRIRLAPQEWLQEATQTPCLLFLDELTLAPRGCLAAVLTLIQDRQLAGLRLHPGSRIVAAANPPEFTGAELPPPVANRFLHLEFDSLMPTEDWLQGMLGSFPDPSIPPLPAYWQAAIPRYRAVVSAFLRAHGPEAWRRPADLGRAWPSRRTWTMAMTFLAAADVLQVDPTPGLAGLVGDGPAMAYLAWASSHDLPDPAACLADPTGTPLPRDEERMFVTLSAVAAMAVDRKTESDWAAAWIILGRAADAGAADVATCAARVLMSRIPPGAPVPKEAAKLLPLLRKAGGF